MHVMQYSQGYVLGKLTVPDDRWYNEFTFVGEESKENSCFKIGSIGLRESSNLVFLICQMIKLDPIVYCSSSWSLHVQFVAYS
jgi:hypothetical protein